MNNTIRREILIPQPRERVWRAIADSRALAGWMFPNDFEPRVGHRFTFQVPPNPKVDFDGLIVRCEVLECEPLGWLVFSWSAGGPVENTQVSFRLEPEGDGTRLFFEHSGFDLSQPWGEQAFQGAEFGWAKMLKQLSVQTDHNIMNQGTKRSIHRWIHIIFGLPILGYIYGPVEEVAQYAPIFRFVFVPVLVLSGFLMWKGDALLRLISKKST